MENFNKLLNFIIVFLIILFIIIMLISLFIPLLYNGNTRGKVIQDFSDYKYIEYSLKTYLDYYKNENIKALKSCTPLLRKKDDYIYEKAIENYIKNKNNTFLIKNMEVKRNNIYIIDYYYNIDFIKDDFDNYNTNRIILKLYKSKGTFEIYYDSMVELENGV